MAEGRCENGHVGFMKEFSKEGRTWWSCTFKYGDGQTCWGKAPKDSPVLESKSYQAQSGWNHAPVMTPTGSPAPDMGAALKVALEITTMLNTVEDLVSFGPRKVAESVRRMAVYLATGVLTDVEHEAKPGMTAEQKLEQIRLLKAQMDAIGDI